MFHAFIAQVAGNGFDQFQSFFIVLRVAFQIVGEIVIEDGCDEWRGGRGWSVPVDHVSKIEKRRKAIKIIGH